MLLLPQVFGLVGPLVCVPARRRGFLHPFPTKNIICFEELVLHQVSWGSGSIINKVRRGHIPLQGLSAFSGELSSTKGDVVTLQRCKDEHNDGRLCRGVRKPGLGEVGNPCGMTIQAVQEVGTWGTEVATQGRYTSATQ